MLRAQHCNVISTMAEGRRHVVHTAGELFRVLARLRGDLAKNGCHQAIDPLGRCASRSRGRSINRLWCIIRVGNDEPCGRSAANWCEIGENNRRTFVQRKSARRTQDILTQAISSLIPRLPAPMHRKRRRRSFYPGHICILHSHLHLSMPLFLYASLRSSHLNDFTISPARFPTLP